VVCRPSFEKHCSKATLSIDYERLRKILLKGLKVLLSRKKIFTYKCTLS
jgi:hypothetical protein